MKINNEFKLGLLTIVSMTVLYVGFKFLKGSDVFSDSNYYYAYYEDIGGLKKSNAVSLNGLIVGRVNELLIDQKGGDRILVEIDLENNIQLGKGASATLSNTLTGTYSLNLSSGDLSQPIQEGDTIAGAVDGGMMDVVGEYGKPIQKTLNSADSLIGNLQGSTVIKLEETLTSISMTMNSLNRFINNNQTGLKGVVENLKQTTDALADEKSGLKATLANLHTMSDSLKSVDIGQTVKKLDASLASMTKTLDSMQDGKGTLDKLLNDDSLYINLNRTTKELGNLAKHLNEQPKHFLGFLAKSKKRIKKDGY